MAINNLSIGSDLNDPIWRQKNW